MSDILDLRKKQKQTARKNNDAPIVSQSPVEKNSTLKPIVQKQNSARALYASLPLKEIKWVAPPYNSIPISRMGVVVGIGAVFAFVLFIFLDDIFAPILVLAAIFALFANRKISKMSHPVTIDEVGITIDEKIHKYSSVKSFWIDYNPGSMKRLSMEMKKKYLPYMTVNLGDQSPIELRKFILQYISEEEHQLSIIEAFLYGR